MNVKKQMNIEMKIIYDEGATGHCGGGGPGYPILLEYCTLTMLKFDFSSALGWENYLNLVMKNS